MNKLKEFGVSRFSDDEIRTRFGDSTVNKLRCSACQTNFGGIKASDLCPVCVEKFDEHQDVSFELCEGCTSSIDLLLEESARKLTLPKSRHNTRHADWIEYVPGSPGFCVDAHMFDLLKFLNDSGVGTRSSCEGTAGFEFGRANIMFSDVTEASEVYRSVVQWAVDNDPDFEKRIIKRGVHPKEWLNLDVGFQYGKDVVDVCASLYLAYHDVPLVLSILKE